MHLLVIEDERALCETIVRSLRRLAYSAVSYTHLAPLWSAILPMREEGTLPKLTGRPCGTMGSQPLLPVISWTKRAICPFR